MFLSSYRNTSESLGETLVLLDVVSQGFFGNDSLSCNCFCIGMLKMQGYYLCIQAEVTYNEQYYKLNTQAA